jgi:hypothetical protein
MRASPSRPYGKTIALYQHGRENGSEGEEIFCLWTKLIQTSLVDGDLIRRKF